MVRGAASTRPPAQGWLQAASLPRAQRIVGTHSSRKPPRHRNNSSHRQAGRHCPSGRCIDITRTNAPTARLWNHPVENPEQGLSVMRQPQPSRRGAGAPYVAWSGGAGVSAAGCRSAATSMRRVMSAGDDFKVSVRGHSRIDSALNRANANMFPETVSRSRPMRTLTLVSHQGASRE